MKIIKILGILLLGVWATGCDNNMTLQRYYVDNQDNKDFVAIDLPASMLSNSANLSEDQRKTLQTIRKINVLALPKNHDNDQKIEEEKGKVRNILNDERYELLARFGGGASRVEVYFTGEDDAVDELIVYGFDDSRGMGIARVLGNKMNPGEIMALMQSMETGDLNLEGLSQVTNLFIEKAN